MSNEPSLQEVLELAIKTGNSDMASEIIKLAKKIKKTIRSVYWSTEQPWDGTFRQVINVMIV